MSIGERIKARRIELGLSQEELAHRLGNKSRASVSTVEHDKEDLTTTRIKQYATALECTPAYLMGWEDITDANGVEVMAKVPDFVVQLSPDESVLIEAYREDQSFKDMINRLLIYAGKIGEDNA